MKIIVAHQKQGSYVQKTQDDGEQGAHAEDYQGVADVAESADEHDDGEQEEDAQQPHGDRPKKLFNTHSPEKYDIMRLALRRKP